MSLTQSNLVRHRAEFLGEQLILHIPSRQSSAQVPYLLIWLIVCLFGCLTAVSTLNRVSLGRHLFMLAWVIFWMTSGLFAITTLLWLLFGEEVIVLSDEQLSIKRQIFGVGKTKSFDTGRINDFRVLSHPAAPTVCNSHRGNQIPLLWKMTGPMTFAYDTQTYRFGDGVDKAEAQQIVTEIQKYNPKFV